MVWVWELAGSWSSKSRLPLEGAKVDVFYALSPGLLMTTFS